MGETVVDRQVSLAFTLGKYVDEVMFDVVPMEATHILLGRPWKFDRKVTYNGSQIVLKPLSSREVCKDQIKMRIKREEERKEKEKDEKAREKKKREKKEKSKSANEKKEDDKTKALIGSHGLLCTSLDGSYVQFKTFASCVFPVSSNFSSIDLNTCTRHKVPNDYSFNYHKMAFFKIQPRPTPDNLGLSSRVSIQKSRPGQTDSLLDRPTPSWTGRLPPGPADSITQTQQSRTDSVSDGHDGVGLTRSRTDSISDFVKIDFLSACNVAKVKARIQEECKFTKAWNGCAMDDTGIGSTAGKQSEEALIARIRLSSWLATIIEFDWFLPSDVVVRNGFDFRPLPVLVVRVAFDSRSYAHARLGISLLT
ncbi:hypothetical protein CR513_08231, partial [Mucuna pruriens]